MGTTGMPEQRAWRVCRPGVLLLASIPLWLIYSNPPLERCAPPPDLSGVIGASDTNASKLLLDEHKKVIDEIRMHLDEENQLFRYKFALVGALLLAFLGHIAFPQSRGKTEDTATAPDERISQLMNSSATCAVLALAFAIAVAIDLHIRTATIATNQLGLWIRDYVEPAFIQKPLVGYETYLRLPGAMNDFFLYGFAYWPPLHLLSWVIYLAYLIVLQNVCVHRTPTRLPIFWGFALVHFALAAFVWMGHAAPSAFQFRVFGWSVNGIMCPLLYLVPWIFLVGVNWYYVRSLFGPEEARAEYAQANEVHPAQKRRGASA